MAYKDPEKAKSYQAEWRKKNLPRMAAHQRNWRKRNPDAAAATAKSWRKNNIIRFAAMKRAWRLANPEKVAAQKKRHREKHAAEIRLKNRRYQQANKDKTKVFRNRSRAKNPQKIRDQGRIHRANRRAAETAGAGLSANIVETLLLSQMNVCTYCPTDLRVERYHLDHRTPLSRGGRHEDANMQLTCAPCNLSKFTMTHEEFITARQ